MKAELAWKSHRIILVWLITRQLPSWSALFSTPESLEKDKLAYLNFFFKEFENCALSIDNRSLRLIILRNHMRGHAPKLINHLTISDENCGSALDILNSFYPFLTPEW